MTTPLSSVNERFGSWSLERDVKMVIQNLALEYGEEQVARAANTPADQDQCLIMLLLHSYVPQCCRKHLLGTEEAYW